MKFLQIIFCVFIIQWSANAQTVDSISLKKGFPVVINKDTLFFVKNRSAALTAQERAIRTTNIILEIENNIIATPDSIKLADYDTFTDIIFNDKIIYNVSQQDADSLKTDRIQLANNYRTTIINHIKQYKTQISLSELLSKAGIGLIIILALITILHFFNKYYNDIFNTLILKIAERFNGIKIKNYQLLTKAGEIKLMRKIFYGLKYVFMLLLVYMTLPFIFRLFPWTKAWSDTLLDFIISPLKNIFTSIINFIPNLITILIIFFVFKYINQLIKYLSNEIEKGKLTIQGFYPEWAAPTYNLVRFALFAFMLIVIWPFLPGSDSTIFKGVSVFIGIIISFGSSTAIGNIVAGLFITYMRPFRIGDRVKIGDITGDVIEKAFLVTRLKTIKNEIITIPNSAILNGNTTNYSIKAKEEGLIIHTTLTMSYNTPWPKIHEMLITAALKTPGTDSTKQPFVFQTSLDDWYVAYQLNVYIKEANIMDNIYSDLHQEIQNVFNENGIEIMSPHYLSIRDGNPSTSPGPKKA